jgi:hypothetical protein
MHKKPTSKIMSGLTLFDRYNSLATVVWNKFFSTLTNTSDSGSIMNPFLPPGVTATHGLSKLSKMQCK